jgi:hypothetical protein
VTVRRGMRMKRTMRSRWGMWKMVLVFLHCRMKKEKEKVNGWIVWEWFLIEFGCLVVIKCNNHSTTFQRLKLV